MQRTGLTVIVAGEKQQIAYETLQARAVLGQQGRGLRPVGDAGVGERNLQLGAKGRERGLQLVRGVSDKLPLKLACRLESIEHRVHGLRQARDLTASLSAC